MKTRDGKSIYDMKLFDTIELLGGNVVEEYIIRVPGGWIFKTFPAIGDSCSPNNMSAVFVPFNEEFRKSEKLK